MPENPSHGDVRYEKGDANIGGILGFAAGLLVLLLIVLATVAAMFDLFRDQARRDDPPLSTLAAQERLRLPRDLARIPSPRLQQDEIADLQRLRAEEDRRLKEYGWVDSEAGTVHMPISEAMRLLADPKIAERHGIRTELLKKGGR